MQLATIRVSLFCESTADPYDLVAARDLAERVLELLLAQLGSALPSLTRPERGLLLDHYGLGRWFGMEECHEPTPEASEQALSSARQSLAIAMEEALGRRQDVDRRARSLALAVVRGERYLETLACFEELKAEDHPLP